MAHPTETTDSGQASTLTRTARQHEPEAAASTPRTAAPPLPAGADRLQRRLTIYLTDRKFERFRDLIGAVQFMNRCVEHWHFHRFTSDAHAGRLRLFGSGY